jgi:tetratricopeptide (TPR) repeat protein
MSDSALKLHPIIDSSYNLQNIRSLIYGTIENKEYFIEKSTISYENNKVYVKGNFSENTVNFLNLYKDSATNAFMKADYKNAIRLFKIASTLDAKNYAYYENIGICYFTMNDFATADSYFTKSIDLGGVSGKSELYKGVSLIQLGNVEKGCKFLYLAKSRNFTEVNPDEQIKLYCK